MRELRSDMVDLCSIVTRMYPEKHELGAFARKILDAMMDEEKQRGTKPLSNLADDAASVD